MESKIFHEKQKGKELFIHKHLFERLRAGHHAQRKTTNKRMALLFHNKEWQLVCQALVGPWSRRWGGKVLWCQIILILYVLLNNTDFILKAGRGFWGVELGLERALFGVDFLLSWTVVWLLAWRSTTWERSWRWVHHWMKAIQGRWGGPGPDLGVVTSQQDATDWMDAGVFNLGL